MEELLELRNKASLAGGEKSETTAPGHRTSWKQSTVHHKVAEQKTGRLLIRADLNCTASRTHTYRNRQTGGQLREGSRGADAPRRIHRTQCNYEYRHTFPRRSVNLL